MKGRLNKALLITILSLTSLFVVPQIAVAQSNDARIDGQYPIGVSSDYMLVAGNRVRHTGGATMSGRFMANSMAFNTTEFNDWGIWNNSLNTYQDTPESAKDFYTNLWNPAVVINDFTKENTIKDPAFVNPTTILTANIVGMWPYVKNTDPNVRYPDSQKRVRFITDTSKSDVETSVGSKNKNLVDTAWKNNLDTETEDGTAINGLGDLTQFQDNNVTKYQTQNDAVAGRSVETDIQDVSQYYNSLASGNDAASSFSASDSRIIDDDSENPQYIAEDDPNVAAVVINIKRNTDVADAKSKTVVAVSIDKQKMIQAVNKAGNHSGNVTGMHVLFNFSKEFYDADGKLDAAKIPYIVLNYKGFTHGSTPGQFTWGDSDGFGTAEIKDGKLVNEEYMNEALGVTKGDWDNPKVLWMGSQILNNFTDIYDLDNYPENVSSASRDMAGLGSEAAVYFKSKTNLMYGSFLIPHGSFYAGNASGASFVGGVTAANNITLDGYGAPISPDQNDGAFGVFGRKENGNTDFPNLNEPGSQLPETAISKIDLTNKATTSVLEDGGTAAFDYANGDLQELPKSGIKANVHIKNAPDKFGLYYKLKQDKAWHRLGADEYDAETADDTDVDITDLESLFEKNNDFDTGSVKNKLKPNDSSHMGYTIGRNNEIEFAVSKDYDQAQVADTELAVTAKFNIKLVVNGTLEVSVPKNLDMGHEQLGMQDDFVRKIKVNEVSTPYKNIAPQFDGDTPVLNVYNPMHYKFKLGLQHLDEDNNNPLKMMKNFSYQLTINEPTNDYLSMVDGSTELIDVLNRSSDTVVDPEDPGRVTIDSQPLQNKIIYFKMPYSNDYKTGKYTADLTWNLELK